jgi:uncharacterized protein (UPF0276 family)
VRQRQLLQQQLWRWRRLWWVRKLMGDLVGLGWRGELSAGILDSLEAIDVVEVIAEDWMNAPRRDQQALRTLASEIPLVLHGVALGLASSFPAEPGRLDRVARLVDMVRPLGWSEHLAFVRAGPTEIGHLAAPPRTAATVEGTVANIERARRIVGRIPAMENIATLIEPPVSAMDEPGWTRAIVEASGAPLLLDLHNLYANAVNFGQEPRELLAQMPLERVEMVHLSGGRWITRGSRPRLLDDHLHDVPDPVFDLLEELAARNARPLTVIVERDGCFPEFGVLLSQVARARKALAAGRRRGHGEPDRRAA